MSVCLSVGRPPPLLLFFLNQLPKAVVVPGGGGGGCAVLCTVTRETAWCFRVMTLHAMHQLAAEQPLLEKRVRDPLAIFPSQYTLRLPRNPHPANMERTPYRVSFLACGFCGSDHFSFKVKSCTPHILAIHLNPFFHSHFCVDSSLTKVKNQKY
jgi:hypothetical protein